MIDSSNAYKSNWREGLNQAPGAATGSRKHSGSIESDPIDALGTVTAAPYTFTWSNVPAGTYTLTAVATDNLNNQVTSAAVAVTVKSGMAQAYYIHTDHLDTTRLITDTSGNVVWEWQNSDPFGNNIPNENPTGAGQFSFNLRFAGQYFDKETGLYYNVFRSYDPASGRYVESDPTGLWGGINTYTYVEGNPLSWNDPLGLIKVKDPSVDISNITSRISDHYSDIDKAVNDHTTDNEAVITSGNDSIHKGSNKPGTDCSTEEKCRDTSDTRHYHDDAIDIRNKDFPAAVDFVLSDINKKLPEGCKAILEGSPPHIHIQCSELPKPKENKPKADCPSK